MKVKGLGVILGMSLHGVCFAKEISVLQYCERVLAQSNSAQSIEESARIAALTLDTVSNGYEFQVTPVASLSTGNQTETQSFGVEANKQTTFGPEITLGSSYNRYESSAYTSESPRVYATIEQGLFRNWGQRMTRAPLTQAEFNQQQQLFQNRSDRQTLLRRGLQLYFDLLLLNRQLTLREASVTRSAKNLEIAESRHELGLVSKTDIYRARLALLNAKDSLQSLKNQSRQTRRSFAELINVDFMLTSINVKPQLVSFMSDWPKAPVNVAMANRGDWQRFLIEEKAIALDLYQAQENLKPDLRLSVTGEKYLDSYAENDTQYGDKVNWSVRLQYSTPFDLTAEENALERQQIVMRSYLREKASFERQIRQEIQDAQDDIDLLAVRMAISEQKLEQAKQAIELAELRYQRGLSNNLDLIDAETAYQSAEVDLVTQQVSYNMALVRFAQVLGILDMEWLSYAVQ